MSSNITIDPKLDLVLDRLVPAPRAKLWRGWTEPALIKQWFAPLPWTITEAAIEPRAGGAFSFTMRSPEGQSFPNAGLLLEVVPQQKIVFTDTLVAGYRPSPPPLLHGRSHFGG
ncbi:MAG TPA: SRPBCC domain-containing protein [Dongiaceae bacterium]|nr:SRPBCC domain-containing protein [Dongiaceae bacterium]